MNHKVIPGIEEKGLGPLTAPCPVPLISVQKNNEQKNNENKFLRPLNNNCDSNKYNQIPFFY